VDVVAKTMERPFYMNPQRAIDFGVIDKVQSTSSAYKLFMKCLVLGCIFPQLASADQVLSRHRQASKGFALDHLKRVRAL